MKVIKYLLTILLIPIFILIFVYKGAIENVYNLFYDIGCVIAEEIDNMYEFWFKGGWKNE